MELNWRQKENKMTNCILPNEVVIPQVSIFNAVRSFCNASHHWLHPKTPSIFQQPSVIWSDNLSFAQHCNTKLHQIIIHGSQDKRNAFPSSLQKNLATYEFYISTELRRGLVNQSAVKSLTIVDWNFVNTNQMQPSTVLQGSVTLPGQCSQ